MKYLHTSMMGSYNIDCELIRDNADGTVDIKYIDPVSEETTEESVDIEDVQWEMKDRFDHTIKVDIAEGVVVFKEPVVVGYYPREKEFPPQIKDILDNVHSVGEGRWFIDYEYDFGMNDRYYFKEGYNWLGVNDSMKDEEIVRRIVEFDLAHAFDHPQEDPNYNHTHWALYGNLKDRFKEVLDPEE